MVSGKEGFSYGDLAELRKASSSVIREYQKGAVVLSESPGDRDSLLFVESGMVYLTTINAGNQRRILDYFGKGSVMGGYLLDLPRGGLRQAVAQTRCRVEIFRLREVLAGTGMEPGRRGDIIGRLLAAAARRYGAHLDILGQQTLRSRLLAYFEYLGQERGVSSFVLPLSFTDLADYLSVDRSAMMRELKWLGEEGVIRADKHRIILL